VLPEHDAHVHVVRHHAEGGARCDHRVERAERALAHAAREIAREELADPQHARHEERLREGVPFERGEEQDPDEGGVGLHALDQRAREADGAVVARGGRGLEVGRQVRRLDLARDNRRVERLLARKWRWRAASVMPMRLAISRVVAPRKPAEAKQAIAAARIWSRREVSGGAVRAVGALKCVISGRVNDH
jgi:hypothetical protein